MLVRAAAWWYNKLPLSIAFVLLLADGRRADTATWMALGLVVLTVCGAANYGYALNELFDVEEDARIGRNNVAARIGHTRVWFAAALSAACCVACAWFAAGWIGAALGGMELCLPATYSIPPVRTKERRWLGVLSDALAAHVFPVAIALAACAHLGVRTPTAGLIAASLIWALAAGLRGILSHQLHTAEQDRRGGLRTVVSDAHGGRQPLERTVVTVLVPLECAALLAIVAQCTAGPFLWIVLALYAVIEIYKTTDRRFVVTVLRPDGQRHVPMLQENLYKAWLPLAVAFDAARIDPWFLLVALFYAVVFRVHLQIEGARLRNVFEGLRTYGAQGTGQPFQ